jgi:hypothetical protein
MCIVLCCPLMLCSQPQQGGGGGAGSAVIDVHGGQGVIVSEMAGGFTPANPPKGAPYCADFELEYVQTLASGNHIRNISKGHECRDSQGRSYNEQELGIPRGGVPSHKIVTITDLVSGTHTRLFPERKIAQVSTFGRLRPREVVAQPQRELTRIPLQVIKPPTHHVEDLGEKEIDGVLAHGQKRTSVFPEGERGNEAPLTDSVETWIAVDLKIVVLSIDNSEEHGVTTRRIKNLQRIEPDPALFQVPPDYTIEKS